jgi:hypothetical protein
MFTLPVALMVHSTSVTPETSSGELLFTMQGMGEDTHDHIDRSPSSLLGLMAVGSRRCEQNASSNLYHTSGNENWRRRLTVSREQASEHTIPSETTDHLRSVRYPVPDKAQEPRYLQYVLKKGAKRTLYQLWKQETPCFKGYRFMPALCRPRCAANR